MKHNIKNFAIRGLCAAACVLSAGVALAGDFSAPRPYSANDQRATHMTLEAMRRGGGAGGMGPYVLGDYFERYQSATNWNNAVLSGNTIILNGDNNSVTLTTDGSTVTQNSDGTCQSSSNNFLNNGGTATPTSTTCGAP